MEDSGKYKVMRRRKALPFPCIWNGLSQTDDRTRELHGDAQDLMYYFFSEGMIADAHPKSSWDRISDTIVKRIMGDKGYLDSVYKKNLEYGKKLVLESNEVLKRDLSHLDIHQLLEEYDSLKKAWILFDQTNDPPWFIAGDSFHAIVRKTIMENHPELKDPDFLALTTPSAPSQVMREELDVLGLVAEVKRDRKAMDALSEFKGLEALPPDIARRFAILEGEYGCIPYGYDGPTMWGVDHYMGKVAESLSMDDKVMKEKISELESYSSTVSSKQKDIISKFKLSNEEQRLCEALKTLAGMTDQRKEYTFRCHAAVGRVMDEIANKLDLPKISVRYLLPEEIRSMHSDPDALNEIAQHRINDLFVFEFRKGKYKVIEGEEAESLIDILPEDERLGGSAKFIVMRKRPDPPIPATWNGMSNTGDDSRRVHGDTQDLVYHFYEDGLATGVHLKSSWDRLAETIANRIMKDKGYLDSIYKKNLEYGRALALESDSFMKFDASGLSLEQLLTEYLSLRKAWLSFDQINFPTWLVAGDKLNKEVRKMIMDNHPDLEDSDFLTLTTPSYSSQVMREELEVLKLALEAKNDKKAAETLRKGFGNGSIESLPVQIAKGLAVLEEKYGCVPYGYSGPTMWDIRYYFGKVGELIGTDDAALKGRIFELESYADGISKRHSEIEGTFGLSQEEIRLCESLRTLAIMADQKKEFQFRCHVALGKVLNEMADKLGVPESSLRYVFPEEIEKLRSTPEEINKIAKQRMQNLFVVEFRGGKYRAIEGEEAEALRSILPKEEKGDVLKGEVGSLGSSQVTRGKARVLLSTKDIHVLEEGEILVATMTTPDYVVAMKKASAIVTDEGGVTCHAAIVARELGIPCVIATHSATRRIRTGDEIEVDVGTGEVRIIKRA